MAIAAHLGIDPAHPVPAAREQRPRDVRRSGAPGGSEHREADSEDAHAVVRTVARRLSGRVKQYHPERGYGFVVSPDAPGDVFFHRSDCRADPVALEPSAVVSFDLVEMANGQFKAINLAPRA